MMGTFGKRRVAPRRDWSTLSHEPRTVSERKGLPKADGQTENIEIIAPADYPQMATPEQAAELAAELKSPEAIEKAEEIIAEQKPDLRSNVVAHVERLEAANAEGDIATLYEEAHEIRGLADTAGLRAAGRIANGLCQYLDTVTHNDIAPDATAITLHVEAISRAARADDETTMLGNVVADELAALVNRKLSEASATIH